MNVDRSNKRKEFYTKKTINIRYPAETISGTDYADDQVLLINTSAQTESLLLSLEQAVEGIGFYVNANKTVSVF